MGYESRERSSAAGPIIAIVGVVGLLLFGILVAVGLGAWLLMRTETRRTQVALEEAEQARAVAERQRVASLEAPAAMPEVVKKTRVGIKKIVVDLNREGRITVDGRPLDPVRFETVLREANDNPDVAAAVQFRVDRECPFRYVAEMQALCSKLNVDEVTLAVAEDEGGTTANAP